MFVRDIFRKSASGLKACFAERVVIIRSKHRVVQLRIGPVTCLFLIGALVAGTVAMTNLVKDVHQRERQLLAYSKAFENAQHGYIDLFGEFSRHQEDIRKVGERLRDDVAAIAKWVPANRNDGGGARGRKNQEVERLMENLGEIHNSLALNNREVTARLARLGRQFTESSKEFAESGETRFRQEGQGDGQGSEFASRAEPDLGGEDLDPSMLANAERRVKQLSALIGELRMTQGETDAAAQRSTLGRLAMLRDAVKIAESKETSLQKEIAGLKDKLSALEQKSKTELAQVTAHETLRRKEETSALGAKLAAVSVDYKRLQEQHTEISRRFARAEKDGTYLSEQQKKLENKISSSDEKLRALEDKLASAGVLITEKQTRLTSVLNTLETNDAHARMLEKRLDAMEVALLGSQKEKDRLDLAQQDLRGQNEKLIGHLGNLDRAYVQLMQKFVTRTKGDLDTIEGALRKTGLNINKMLKKVTDKNSQGLGGPFVSVAPGTSESTGAGSGNGGDPDVEQDPEWLRNYLSRWEGVNKLVRVLPLSAPLKRIKIVSPYGRRLDPINGKPAMHLGVDFQGRSGTRVLAAGDGIVRFTGWKGSFGRLVEIDHGYGIRTRYGHLRKGLVKRGQKVKTGDVLGLIGSSGRSTGAHLHYEVVVGKRSYNPTLFIKAGANVFKNLSR